MEASRVAQTRSGGDDVKKRLMVVPDVHVTRLVTTQRNGTTAVTAVLLKQFGNASRSVPVPDDGVVVIALGTIESTRLALTSFPNLPNTNLIGQNLIAHLRSNLTIRIPRSALPAGLPRHWRRRLCSSKGKLSARAERFRLFPSADHRIGARQADDGLRRPNCSRKCPRSISWTPCARPMTTTS